MLGNKLSKSGLEVYKAMVEDIEKFPLQFHAGFYR